jgi:hypothetical protein
MTTSKSSAIMAISALRPRHWAMAQGQWFLAFKAEDHFEKLIEIYDPSPKKSRPSPRKHFTVHLITCKIWSKAEFQVRSHRRKAHLWNSLQARDCIRENR